MSEFNSTPPETELAPGQRVDFDTRELTQLPYVDDVLGQARVAEFALGGSEGDPSQAQTIRIMKITESQNEDMHNALAMAQKRGYETSAFFAAVLGEDGAVKAISFIPSKDRVNYIGKKGSAQWLEYGVMEQGGRNPLSENDTIADRHLLVTYDSETVTALNLPSDARTVLRGSSLHSEEEPLQTSVDSIEKRSEKEVKRGRASRFITKIRGKRDVILQGNPDYVSPHEREEGIPWPISASAKETQGIVVEESGNNVRVSAGNGLGVMNMSLERDGQELDIRRLTVESKARGHDLELAQTLAGIAKGYVYAHKSVDTVVAAAANEATVALFMQAFAKESAAVAFESIDGSRSFATAAEAIAFLEAERIKEYPTDPYSSNILNASVRLTAKLRK